MRRALNGNPPITTKHGTPGYGYFGAHAGYDYGVNGQAVFAPEAGTIINVYPGTPDGGNIIELQGAYTHRFLHLNSIGVSKGQKVAEGQQIGVSGATGKVTGPHLHHDVRKNGTAWNQAYSNYVDWEAMIKQVPQGGANVFNTIEEVKEAYLQMRGVVGTDAEMRGWIGQSKQRWIQMSKAETDSTRKQLADVRAALDKLQKQPPKEVIKEVIKIVDRPIEVIKEVPAPSDPDDITINKNSFWSWLSSALSIFKKKDN